jgi:hypothetical protein
MQFDLNHRDRPVAFRAQLAGTHLLVEAQTLDGTWRPLASHLQLSVLSFALTGNRLSRTEALNLRRNLTAALTPHLQLTWHLDAFTLELLIAELSSHTAEADLDGCPLGETP